MNSLTCPTSMGVDFGYEIFRGFYKRWPMIKELPDRSAVALSIIGGPVSISGLRTSGCDNNIHFYNYRDYHWGSKFLGPVLIRFRNLNILMRLSWMLSFLYKKSSHYGPCLGLGIISTIYVHVVMPQRGKLDFQSVFILVWYS